MKIISPNVSLIDLPTLAAIEFAGRTCYKSNSTFSSESAVLFAKKMYEHDHTAMLEHGILYMIVEDAIAKILEKNKYLNCTESKNGLFFVSGSLRTFLAIYSKYKENPDRYSALDSLFIALSKSFEDEFFTVDPEHKTQKYEVQIFKCAVDFIDEVNKNEFDEMTTDDVLRKHVYHTLKFICDRGVSHEIVRHRPASYAQESTRYCKYDLDKFGNEITVIKPLFFEEGSKRYEIWKEQCLSSERAYNELCEDGATAQEARTVLNNSLKTELVVTTTEDEWQHMLNLRYHGTTGPAHPQAVEVFAMAQEILVAVSDGRVK